MGEGLRYLRACRNLTVGVTLEFRLKCQAPDSQLRLRPQAFEDVLGHVCYSSLTVSGRCRAGSGDPSLRPHVPSGPGWIIRPHRAAG